MERETSEELEHIKQRLALLEKAVFSNETERLTYLQTVEGFVDEGTSSLYYSGQIRLDGQLLRWEPQARRMEGLMDIPSEEAGKALAALGSKLRLDIVRSVLTFPLTGAELVERLQMGTTGQLYHHLKALLGTGLIEQRPGGRYVVPRHRCLPVLLLLAAAGDLAKAAGSGMEEARSRPGMYFGSASTSYDPTLLLKAVLENSVLEHRAGYCDRVDLFLHDDGSATVADDGRGIPVEWLPQSGVSQAEAVLTDIRRFEEDAPFTAPGAEKGIGIAVVNAFSKRITVEIRREGFIYKQSYEHGIPTTKLNRTGRSEGTGTSVTLLPDPEFFEGTFRWSSIQEYVQQLRAEYPKLTIEIFE
ncbi:ATP-binding protein [Paenibacillus sp. TRM 82003]|nr:ATP-binding protein [Paenibacillus sp. TRM 82003]